MFMSGYTKLFNSILASTIWREPNHVRIVWITLLAMADKHGVAEGSVPGLADFARVSLEDCEDALARLQEPDKHSRSKDFDGRRIMPIDGGWQILNHTKYREKMSDDERRTYLRIKQAEYRERKRGAVSDTSTSVNNVSDTSTLYTQAEAEAEAEAAPDAEAKSEQQQKQQNAAPAAGFRVQADGPLAGSLPRDHMNCVFCGARFCVSRKTLSAMARSYGDGGEAAALAWVQTFHDTLGGQAYGGPVWLLQHFDAHLMASGRVTPPAPAPKVAPKRSLTVREALQKAGKL